MEDSDISRDEALSAADDDAADLAAALEILQNEEEEKRKARETLAKERLHAEKCQCGKWSGRNLVVCIDGTSNQFSTKVSKPLPRYLCIRGLTEYFHAEHQRRRAVQPLRKERQTVHILRQRYRDFRWKP